MNALLKRKAEWEMKNELVLEQAKVQAVTVLSLLIFLLWRIAVVLLNVAKVIMKRPKLVRRVSPERPYEEVDVRLLNRIYEQGPFIR